jgi:hypothetical protein
VLGELRAAIETDGVLFASNPRGENEEGWNRNRYSSYHDLEAWARVHGRRPASPSCEHYYRPPGVPREEQPWLASVWRKNP